MGPTCAESVQIDKVNAIEKNQFQDHAMCSSWRGKNYVTFDKKTYTFPGKGTYTMVQDCKESPLYKVSLNHTYSCQPNGCQTSVNIKVKDIQVVLTPDSVTVNGKAIQLPTSIDCLVITEHASYILVTGISELKVLYDRKSTAFVFAPITMKNVVCGMCGNYNEVDSDDFKTLTGEPLPDQTATGNYYKDPTDTRNVPDEVKPEKTACASSQQT